MTETQCDQCGQTDTHPKWHYGNETYHHDCAPHTVIRDVTTYGYWRDEPVGDGTFRRTWVDGIKIPDDKLDAGIKRALKARDLALKGTRGERLQARIQKMAEDEGANANPDENEGNE